MPIKSRVKPSLPTLQYEPSAAGHYPQYWYIRGERSSLAGSEQNMPNTFAGKHLAYWIDTTAATNYPPMPGDISVDVAILGGGITGLTATVLLKRLGKTVAVIEARRIAEGVTGHTTAKVTSQHKLIYDQLIQKHGEEKARLYAEANEAAIDRIEAFVTEKGIDCDFRRLPAFVYTESEEYLGITLTSFALSRRRCAHLLRVCPGWYPSG